jgi:2-succinyl-5-enolpyruvyl-6-hydroxy-3-cyclohexene-1-carboxylate synthase
MNASHLNQLWSQLLIEELARCGVTMIVAAPGSRSTPLALAAADSSRVRTSIHFDERGASFCALGYARATGKPAAVICTSGTAVANCFPAVIEASQDCVPLIVLSADRPPELQETGALQTIDQTAIFGEFARWAFTIPTPDLFITPSFVLSTVDQAYFRSVGTPAGPVHLNCMFREPLAPTGENADWSEYVTPLQSWFDSDRPFTTYLAPKSVDLTELDAVIDTINSSRNGIIVAGPLPSWQDKRAIVDLATHLGWPVFADINSGLRSCGMDDNSILCHHDLLLRSARLRKRATPDCILQFGGTPISKPLRAYLSESHASWIVVNDNPFRQDSEHQVTHRVIADPVAVASALARVLVANRSNLYDLLLSADQVAGVALSDFIQSQADQSLELAIAPEIFSQSDTLRAVYLATSMPIRDAEAGAGRRKDRIAVASNRGVNGIDGTVASAVGFADGLQRPVTLLIGDLALLHDLNSLALIRQSQQPITIVIINNDGGGIFSFLSVANATSHFEDYFGLPHGLTFQHAAQQFGIPYDVAHNLTEFRQHLVEVHGSHESQLIEITGNRDLNLRQHEQLWQSVTEAIHSTLQLT